MKLWRRRWTAAVVVAVTALTAACAGYDTFRDAREEEELGHWDLAVMKFAKAVEANPASSGYRAALERAKIKASEFHFEKGKMYRASGRPELAVVELEQTVLLDPTNDYAQVELRKAREDMAKQDAERNADSHMEKIKKKTRGTRAVTPLLEPSSDRPINLNFPQAKPIKQIYRALADAAGINIIFDPQLKDDNVSIVLTNIEFQKALETLIRQENHFYKIIDERTILIAADTPANRKTYEDLVIRTFFLSNGDVTEVANSLRALLQTTRISVNKAENSITLRDTADKVAIAERIVEQNDKQLSEVVIDVELLQINSDKLQDIGLILSSYSIGASLPSPGGTTDLGVVVPPSGSVGGGGFTWDVLKKASINSLVFTIPSQATLNFIKNNTNAELLAKPQLRISEGQKAQLIIGDKIPIPTTTFNTSTTAGTNIVPITSFQYQDVGIKIDVEPRVHHNKEITLKLTVEVSNVNGTVTQQGQVQPIIGTRTITSNIRLKDGETNFLAGLLRQDKQRTVNTIPFLGDLPLVGRLFSDHNTEVKTTDLVLTLTPHIIRIPDITEEDLTPVYVGTDANISFQGTPRIESPAGTGPFDQPRGQPPAGGRAPAPATTPAPGFQPPPAFPNDPFRPTPPPRPNTPQAEARPSDVAAPSAAAVESSAAVSGAVYSFDPAFLSLAPGQQRSIVLRATGDVVTDGTVSITFNPKAVSVRFARPILTGEGIADARIDNGRVVLQLPVGAPLSGTRAIAELTVVGVAPGRSALAVEGAGAGATAVLEVR